MEPIISCPNCGVELLIPNMCRIVPDKLTFDYKVIGDILAFCHSCSYNVSEYFKDRLNRYQSVVAKDGTEMVDVYPSLLRLIESIAQYLAEHTTTQGNLSEEDAVVMRFGLKGDPSYNPGIIARRVGLTRERVREIINRAKRGLASALETQYLHFPRSRSKFLVRLRTAEDDQDVQRTRAYKLEIEVMALQRVVNFWRRGLSRYPALGRDIKIEELRLSNHAQHALELNQLTTVNLILAYPPELLLSTRNFGRKSFDELVTKLEEREIKLEEHWGPKETWFKS